IAVVLKTYTPEGQDVPNEMVATLMVILVKILERQELTIRIKNLLNNITGRDGSPCFPELVFAFVQQANSSILNQHTRDLPLVPLHMWRTVWALLVEMAIHSSNTD
ncbi:hypothetical protein P153DRAFT_274048, partial [Dothidotthia symphoricarpi CBS 119687]